MEVLLSVVEFADEYAVGRQHDVIGVLRDGYGCPRGCQRAQRAGVHVELREIAVERKCERLIAEIATDDDRCGGARAGGRAAQPDEGVVGIVVEDVGRAGAQRRVVAVELDEAAVEAEQRFGVGVLDGDVGGCAVHRFRRLRQVAGGETTQRIWIDFGGGRLVHFFWRRVGNEGAVDVGRGRRGGFCFFDRLVRLRGRRDVRRRPLHGGGAGSDLLPVDERDGAARGEQHGGGDLVDSGGFQLVVGLVGGVRWVAGRQQQRRCDEDCGFQPLVQDAGVVGWLGDLERDEIGAGALGAAAGGDGGVLGEQDSLAGKAAGQGVEVGQQGFGRVAAEEDSGGPAGEPRAGFRYKICGVAAVESDDDADVAAAGFAEEIVEAVVFEGRFEDDGVYAEGLEVVEALGYAAQVADAGVAGGLEMVGLDGVEDRGVPPGFGL